MMARALEITGPVASGLQLAEGSFKGLVKTVRMVKHLREVPYKLAKLLEEMETSASHFEHLCSDLLKHDSELHKHIQSPSLLNRVIHTVTALREAIDEINEFLSPLAEFGTEAETKSLPINRLWKSVVSLRMEKELPNKLERLGRLHTNLLRELSVVGIELQLTKYTTSTSDGDTSTERLAGLEAQLAALSADVESLRLTTPYRQPLSSSGTPLTSLENSSYSSSVEAMLLESDAWSDTSSDVASQLILTPPSESPRPESPLPADSLSQRRQERMRAHIERRMFPSPKPVLYDGAMCAHLELVLFNIRTYYTKGNFQHEPTVMKPRFWIECQDSIYFFKIGDIPKAQLSLQKSLTTSPDDVFVGGSAVALIEILSTLSPINTAVSPHIRKTLLAYLYNLAIKNLPRWSPIVVVISRLYEGMDSADWSVRALVFIVDRLRASLDPTNRLRLLAEERFITLLRRGHYYDEALKVCNDTIQGIKTALGPDSPQERKLARCLEHIYIDQCEWDLALDVCFKIVDQRLLDKAKEPMPDPQSHDECAVWTMEDIAKIYDCAGNFILAIAWLKQARISGGICWGAGVRLEHIHDKLLELLKQHELDQQAQLWSTAFGPVHLHQGDGML